MSRSSIIEATNHCPLFNNTKQWRYDNETLIYSAERNLQGKIVRGEGLPLKALSRRNTKKGWTLLIIPLL